METHSGPYCHQLAPHRPYLLRPRFRKGQVMAPDQLELHKLEGVRVILVLVPLQRGLHGVIVLGAQLIVGTFRRDRHGKGGQEFVTGWEVPDGEAG